MKELRMKNGDVVDADGDEVLPEVETDDERDWAEQDTTLQRVKALAERDAEDGGDA